MSKKDSFISGFDISDYDNGDFGITAVSEEEIENNATKPTPEPAPVQDIQVLNELRLEVTKISKILADAKKMNEIANVQNSENAHNLGEQNVESIREQWSADLLALERLYLPLLVSLSKEGSEDKAYIRWPNRGPVIKQQIQRILEITRKFSDE